MNKKTTTKTELTVHKESNSACDILFFRAGGLIAAGAKLTELRESIS